MGVPALGMTALAFPIAAVSIVLSAAFQSLDRSSCSLLVSFLRQIILLLPLAYLLLRLAPDLVWLCFLAAEVLTALVTVWIYLRTTAPQLRRLQ